MIHPVDYAPSQDFGDNPTSMLPASHWIIQQFGNYQPDGHTGTDYPCPSGTQVKAVAAGTVLHVGWLTGTYASNPWWISPSFAGYVYVVDHGSFIGIYGHCLNGGNWVNAGDRVGEGQTLGLSGNTGASTGDHLHFEALPDGFTLNSRMYGRINPATLFGGLSYAGTTTTPQEDTLSASEVASIIDAAQKMHDTTRQFVKDRITENGLAILNGSQEQEDVTRDYLKNQTQAQSDVTRQYLADRIRETSPAEVAALIPDDLVQAFLEALSQRLAK